MALTVSYAAHSEVGLVRTNNQDSAYVSPTMLMVADGMGGAAAGDLASAVATWELERTDQHLAERLAAAHAERATSGEPAAEDGAVEDIITVMRSTLHRANDRLIQLVEDDPHLDGMGTTVCGFVLADDTMAVVNIGDSRAYRVRDGSLSRVTRDHSWVQTLVDEGRITEEEALTHPHRNLVMRVLNGSDEHVPDLEGLEVRPGDRLLACSDGLCGLVTDEAIGSVLTADLSREEAVSRLVALAHAAGGYDNITLIVADVEEDGPLGVTQTLGAAAAVARIATNENTAPIPGRLAPESDALESEDRAMTEKERYALQGRRRWSTRLVVALAVLLPLLAIAGGGALWYQYTQAQYYVGANDGSVAVYQGVPDTILGVSLSSVVETDTTQIADLPEYYADKVEANIRVDSLDAAQTTLDELRQKAAQCIAERETTSDSASPSATPRLTDSPSASPSASGSADPSASASMTPSSTQPSAEPSGTSC